MRESAGMCSSVTPTRSSFGRTGTWWRRCAARGASWGQAVSRAATMPSGSTNHCCPQLRRIRPSRARFGRPQTQPPADLPTLDPGSRPPDCPIVAVFPWRRPQAMVQRMITERFDDLDGSPAVETIRFGYAGRDYEIDLNEEHAAALDDAVAPYLEHARRANGVQPRQRRGRKTEDGHRRRPEELRAIRQWAREQGLQVSDRGRIAADVVEKYEAAH